MDVTKRTERRVTLCLLPKAGAHAPGDPAQTAAVQLVAHGKRCFAIAATSIRRRRPTEVVQQRIAAYRVVKLRATYTRAKNDADKT